jgi:hypothetical protein
MPARLRNLISAAQPAAQKPLQEYAQTRLRNIGMMPMQSTVPGRKPANTTPRAPTASISHTRGFEPLRVMPNLLCGDLRLFEDFGITPIQLESLDVVSLPIGRTHFRFRIVK